MNDKILQSVLENILDRLVALEQKSNKEINTSSNIKMATQRQLDFVNNNSEKKYDSLTAAEAEMIIPKIKEKLNYNKNKVNKESKEELMDEEDYYL